MIPKRRILNLSRRLTLGNPCPWPYTVIAVFQSKLHAEQDSIGEKEEFAPSRLIAA